VESKSVAQAVEGIVRSLDTGPANGCQRFPRDCRRSASGPVTAQREGWASDNPRLLKEAGSIESDCRPPSCAMLLLPVLGLVRVEKGSSGHDDYAL
jgi:hypothetical protein